MRVSRRERQLEDEMKTYWAAGLAVGGMLWCGTAFGADVDVTRSPYGEVRQIAVQAGDLDLTRSAGAQELLSRLQFAAVQVCDAETLSPDLKLYAFQQHCMKDTMDRAVASVSSPLVQRLYAADGEEER